MTENIAFALTLVSYVGYTVLGVSLFIAIVAIIAQRREAKAKESHLRQIEQNLRANEAAFQEQSSIPAGKVGEFWQVFDDYTRSVGQIVKERS